MGQQRDLQHEFYDMLMESQYWLPETMVAYQRSQLAQLLRHARANVPFYERRLDPVFTPSGDIDWERWEEIPIVRRSDMVEHRDAMQARLLPRGHGPVGIIETSGSTGLPIRITISTIATYSAAALRWRGHRWQNLDWSKTTLSRLGDGDHALAWPEGENKGPWGLPGDSAAANGTLWSISRLFDTPDVMRFYKQFGASYLNAGPNMAHINALDVQRLGIDVRIEAILAQGNVIRQADRDICREVFGARMVEIYSAKEGGPIANPCPLDRLHVNSEGCLVEILDADGRPCAVGETGRVIVTPFYQTAQPLIRYEQGDWATVGAPCSCGRHHQVIDAIRGRSIAIFHHPDGRSVANLMPDETSSLLASRYWQLAQVGANAYELRYVPTDTESPGNEAAVRALFHQTFFADADLTFVRSAAIPLTSGGKLVEYLSEWRRPDR